MYNWLVLLILPIHFVFEARRLQMYIVLFCIFFFSCFRSLLAQNTKWIRHAVSTYFVSNQTFTTCLVETFRQQQKYNTPTHSPRKWVPKVSFHPCTTMTRHKIHPNHKHSGLDWLVVIYFYFLPLGNNKRKLATLILLWYLLTLV